MKYAGAAIGVPGESIRPVPPLSVPEVGASDLLEYQAVRLFADRARASNPACE
jgi:predicted ATPase